MNELIRIVLSAFFLNILLRSNLYAESLKKDVKNIAILHSYKQGFWTDFFNNGFLQTLNALGENISLNSFYYDSEKFVNKSLKSKNREIEEIIYRILLINPKLIIVADDEAANIAIPILSAKQLPIIFTGINQQQDAIKWLHSNPSQKIPGILESYPFEQTFEMIHKLKKTAKRISIISSKLETSQIVAHSLIQHLASKNNSSKFNFSLNKVVLSDDWSDWKKQVLNMNLNSDAVFILVPYGVYISKHPKHIIDVREMGKWLTHNLNVPTFGIISIHTRIGLLAAICATPEGLGRQTAEMTYRYLSGTPLSSLGIEQLRYHKFEVNRSEAQRLKIHIPDSLLDIATFVDENSHE